MEQTENKKGKFGKDIMLMVLGIVALFAVLYLIKYLLGI